MRPPALAMLVAALVLPAAASADSLAVRVNPERVHAAALSRVSYTGTIAAAAGERVYATVFSYLDPGRGPCAPTQLLEANRPDSQALHMFAVQVAGPFSQRRPFVLPRPGLYRICVYLQHRALTAAVPDAFATALVRGFNARR